jgi:chemotaxis protein CheC
MEDTFAGLNKLQVDALREISSIGAGNAATALSQFLNRTIKMNPPEVCEVTAKATQRFVGKDVSQIMMVTLGVTGDAHGHVLFVFDRKSALDFMRLLMGKDEVELSEMDISALKEVSSVMCGSFLRVLSDTLNALLQMTPPTFISGQPEEIADFIRTHSVEEKQQTVCLDSQLIIEEGGNIIMQLMFVPQASSLNCLLKLLGMDDNKASN